MIGLLLGQVISHTVVFSSHVVGESMYPTYENGDKVYVNMLDAPERGDIMVVDEGDKYVIKRCVGMPGDKIQIIDGIVYIDDKAYDEPYLKDIGADYDPGIAEEAIILSENEYFMLGDNRLISRDSRQVGIITKGQIIGTLIN